MVTFSDDYLASPWILKYIHDWYHHAFTSTRKRPRGINIVIPITYSYRMDTSRWENFISARVTIQVNAILNHIDTRLTVSRCEGSCTVYRCKCVSETKILSNIHRLVSRNHNILVIDSWIMYIYIYTGPTSECSSHVSILKSCSLHVWIDLSMFVFHWTNLGSLKWLLVSNQIKHITSMLHTILSIFWVDETNFSC
jgi:hypothetical protein